MNREISAAELGTAMTPFEEAIRTVNALMSTLPTFTIAIEQSDGYTLASDVLSPINIPAVPSSTMDGYAYAHQDLDGLRTTRFAKVMTGRAIPNGYDTVAPWEMCSVVDDQLVLHSPIDRGSSIRPVGESVFAGSVVAAAGTTLTPLTIGAIASIGQRTVEVARRVRVGILSSGDELKSVGDQLDAGEVFDSNSLMLAALVERCGGEVASKTCLTDDREQILDWLKQASTSCDVIISSGGASVGEHDWVRDALGELGTVHLWRVALKPGKPFAFGTIANASVFVLPGNPASVLACFQAFVVSSLRKMNGHAPLERETVQLTADVSAPPERTFMYPVRVVGAEAHPAELGTSSKLVNHFAANAYAFIEAGGASKGETVEVERFIF